MNMDKIPQEGLVDAEQNKTLTVEELRAVAGGDLGGGASETRVEKGTWPTGERSSHRQIIIGG